MWFLIVLYLSGQQVSADQSSSAGCEAAKAAALQDATVKTAICWYRDPAAGGHPMPPALH